MAWTNMCRSPVSVSLWVSDSHGDLRCIDETHPVENVHAGYVHSDRKYFVALRSCHWGGHIALSCSTVVVYTTDDCGDEGFD